MLKKIIILAALIVIGVGASAIKLYPKSTIEEAIVLQYEDDFVEAKNIFETHTGFPMFSSDAEYYLGKMLLLGKGQIADSSKGLSMILSAANKGNNKAILYLLSSTKKNKYKEKKQEYLNKLASDNVVDAKITMLLDLDDKNSKKANLNRYKTLEQDLLTRFEKEININTNYNNILAIEVWDDIHNLYNLKDSLLKSDASKQVHIDRLYKIALKRANEGNAFWQYFLAANVKFWDIKGDKEKFSLKWYKESAINEHLSGLLVAGFKVKDSNPEQAIQWLDKAKARNSGFAFFTLAGIYYENESVEQNLDLAVNYYAKAYELGKIDAVEKISEIAFSGKLKNVDLKSLKQMLVVTASKDMGKFNNLIKIYEDYDIVSPISTEIKTSIATGVSENKLGPLLTSALMYKHGDGFIQNDEKALEYYLKSWQKFSYRLPEFADEVINFINEDTKRIDFIVNKIKQNPDNKNEELKELTGLAHLFKDGFKLDRVDMKGFYGKYVYDAVHEKNGKQASMVAYLFENKNIDGTENIEQAFKWNLMAAELGNKDEFFTVAYAYGEGKGTDKDKEKADFWYKKDAENGGSVAMYNLGQEHMYKTDTPASHKEAIQWYKKSVDKNYPMAMYQLGQAYKNGKGVKKDLKQAFQWYKKAAEKGADSAYFQLAYAYDYGKGTKENNKLALEWYKKSAEKEQASAMRNIGYMFRDGDGVNKSANKAFDWFLKGARAGDASSMFQAAYRYHIGKGVEKNYGNAFYWYEKELENNGTSSYNNLGNLYFNGEGVAKDKWKAISLYKKGVENKDGWSANALGWKYVNGDPVFKDFKTAKEYFELAIKYGKKDANDGLGYLYEFGKGVSKNIYRAKEYYRKAGTDYAKKRLRALGA